MEKTNVAWADIAGFEETKKALNEAVILPIKFPQFFTDNRKSWRGILLFGAPGNGKTYIANAVAKEANSALFKISCYELISQWLGEPEKKLKNLFAMARTSKPSIVFLDDVEALCPTQSENETESAKNLRLALDVEIHGVGAENDDIIVMGATNRPWVLDATVYRCFERRIHIPMPDTSARRELFKLQVGRSEINSLTEENFCHLAEKTQGYTCADICCVVRDALMQPVRQVQNATHFWRISGPSPQVPTLIVDDLLTPCSPNDDGAMLMSWLDVPTDKLAVPVAIMSDMLRSLASSQPSVNSKELNT